MPSTLPTIRTPLPSTFTRPPPPDLGHLQLEGGRDRTLQVTLSPQPTHTTPPPPHIPQTLRLLPQPRLIHPQLKIHQKAERNFKLRELFLRHAADLAEARVRVGEVFERFHSDAEPCEEEAVDVARGDGDAALVDGERGDVGGGREIDGGGHGAVFVQAEEVVGDADGGWALGVEFTGEEEVVG